MATAIPVGKGYTAAQWEAWFTANAKAGNTVYTGGLKAGTTPLAGKTWAQVYAALYAYGQTTTVKETPDEIAEATEALAAEEAIAVAAGAAATGAAGATAASLTGIDTASILPSWADGLTNLLGDLTSKNTWLRVAKVVVGSIMIIVGLLNLTGADKAVTTAAKGALP